MFRQSNGKLSSRRGFTSRHAATTARRRHVESIDRGEVKVSRSTFGEFWAELVEDKRRYLTPGSHQDFVNHGRKRLLPFLAETRISTVDEATVREWLESMLELVEAGELSHQRR